MDFRRIIAFGKSSHVVSLPKSWLVENKLKKGDLVYLDQDFDKLVITPKEKENEREERKAVINSDGKDFKVIKREISSAFIKYNDYIIVQGKDLHKYSADITKVMHNLIALEIMEQSSEKIVARDFLKVEDIKIKDYFKKEDIVVRSMFVDLMDPKFKNFDELIERQNSVKRVYLLLLKVFKAIARDSMLIKKTDMSLDEIFKYYNYNTSIQNICFSLKVIAENIPKIKSAKNKKILIKIMKDLNDHYLSVMKTLYSNNQDTAYKLSEVRDQQIEYANKNFEVKSLEDVIILQRVVWILFELHGALHKIYD